MAVSHLRVSFLVLCGAAIAYAAIACGSDGGVEGVVENGDGGGKAPPPLADNNGTDADAPQTTMRIAHLAPDLGAIDFCYQAAKTGKFVGPVLRGAGTPSADASADGDSGIGALIDANILDASLDVVTASDGGVDPNDGGTTTIVHRTVSRYVTLDVVGPLTVAIVEAGATSCASPMVTGDVTLDPGKLSTVALFGLRNLDGGETLALSAFTDDRTTSLEKARVRVIHGALGGGKSKGTGPLALRAVAATTTTLAERVEPKRASTPSDSIPVDGFGYASIAPVAPPTSLAISSASSGELGDAGVESWQSGMSDLDLRGGSLHTAFVLSAEQGFVILWCADKSTRGDLTACTVLR